VAEVEANSIAAHRVRTLAQPYLLRSERPPVQWIFHAPLKSRPTLETIGGPTWDLRQYWLATAPNSVVDDRIETH
jgi:hypothetical protein